MTPTDVASEGPSAALGVPGSREPEEAENGGVSVRRIGWTLAGITLLLWSIDLFGYVDNFPWLTPIMAVLTLWGFGTILASWVPRGVDPRLRVVLAWTTVALVVTAFVVWSYTQISFAPAYGTDEVAFDQYAAQLVLHGLNPYVHSMAQAFSIFHISPVGYTYRLNGLPVTQLSYPALSFLLYVPFLAAGWSTQLAIWINVAAWAIGIVVAFALLPRNLRPLILVVGSLGIFISYAVGGITDALFVPLLIGAVYRWDRFGVQSGWRAWRGPILLGLAMAVKQTPWLVLPFLASGVLLEARSRGSWSDAARTGGRYVVIAIGAFVLPNMAFIVANPHAWFSGILTPITGHGVPAGQGLVGLTLFLGVGGGSLGAYSLTLIFAFLALLAIFLAAYPALKRWAVLCPAVVLFFSSRSFGSYLITLVPAAIVAACTVAPSPIAAPWRHWRWVAIGGGTLTAAGLVVVLSYGAPIGLSIMKIHTSGGLATVVSVDVRATNRTNHPLRPSFTMESGGVITAFWLKSGPPRLPAGESADYQLLAPNFASQPPISSAFQVVAFTSGPSSVSVSSPYSATPLHLALVPDHINGFVSDETPVRIKVQLLSTLDQPVRRTGVLVSLSQIIYAQEGAFLGQTRINGGPAGQSPAVARTNRQGVATFVIQGTDAPSTPIYFQAYLVNHRDGFPYGYSQILPLRFHP